MSKVQKSVTGSQLPKGYKQTGVGVIPEDWSLKPFQEIAVLERGKFTARPRNDPKYYGGDIPFIQTGDVTNSNGKITIFSQTLNQEGLKVSKLFPAGTLFFTIAANIGDVGFASFDTACPDSLIAIRTLNEVNKSWLFQELKSRKHSFENLATNNTQLNINLEKLRPYLLPVPSLAEQAAIAHALSDIDALIESLDRLLTKKRQIKQGAMQELLRSKDGWIAAKLKDVAPLQRGFDLPSSQLQQGIYPVVYSNGVQNHHHKYMVKRPGVTTGRSGTLGVINFIDKDFWPHNTTLWVTDFKGNYPKFIYYLYDHIGFEHFGSGSGVPTLNRNDAHDYLCFIPSKLDEQIAIATILSDMDAEIDSIEAKLTKTRQIKQGMMHELLTGRIRLI